MTDSLEVGQGADGTVRVHGKNIGTWVTKEEVAEHAGFDLGEWEIVESKTWTTAMKDNLGEPVQAINVSLRLRPIAEEIVARQIRDDLLAEIRREVRGENPWKRDKGARAPLSPKPGEGHLCELDLFDPHFQKLAWGEETGEDYDLKIAADRYHAAAESLINRAEVASMPARWLFPIGQDLFHTQLNNATAAGTGQDVDTRPKKAAQLVRKLLTSIVFRMLKQAPVDIVVVPGNHAPLSDWFMGEVLDARFEEYDTVRVDNRPIIRKYYRYGKNLIGLTHGDNVPQKRLGKVMAQEARKDWGETIFREWHMGHWHHEIVKDDRGVVLRYLPALAGTDEWHAKQGFTHAMKGARAFIWEPNMGITQTLHHNIPPTEEELDLTSPALRGDS